MWWTLWKGDGGDWLEGHPEPDLRIQEWTGLSEVCYGHYFRARIRADALGWTLRQFCGGYGHNSPYLRHPAPEDNPAGRPLTGLLAALSPKLTSRGLASAFRYSRPFVFGVAAGQLWPQLWVAVRPETF
jgi:hypothetical protein